MLSVKGTTRLPEPYFPIRKRGIGIKFPRPRPPETQQQTQPEEKHKTRKRSSTGMWTCGYCQKVAPFCFDVVVLWESTVGLNPAR